MATVTTKTLFARMWAESTRVMEAGGDVHYGKGYSCCECGNGTFFDVYESDAAESLRKEQAWIARYGWRLECGGRKWTCGVCNGSLEDD